MYLKAELTKLDSTKSTTISSIIWWTILIMRKVEYKDHVHYGHKLTSTFLSMKFGAIWNKKKMKRRELMTIDTMYTELSTVEKGWLPLTKLTLIMDAEYSSMAKLKTTPIMQITNKNALYSMLSHILFLEKQRLAVVIFTSISYLHNSQAIFFMLSWMPTGYFLTFACSHSLKQHLCTYFKVPLHSHGDMKAWSFDYWLTRQILHSLTTKSASSGYRVTSDWWVFLLLKSSGWILGSLLIVVIITAFMN